MLRGENDSKQSDEFQGRGENDSKQSDEFQANTKNNIISYNISSSPIDHYKKTVVIPFIDSLIIQMQDRFFDEDRHAGHLLCLVLSIIVNKALQLDRMK